VGRLGRVAQNPHGPDPQMQTSTVKTAGIGADFGRNGL
jgi:hypothetical protein